MNRSEYMARLSKRLRKLPPEEYAKAMAYFEEYFDEAGPENEQQAINDLGTPEEAAAGILKEMAMSGLNKSHKSVKGGLKSIWIAFLALCAAPVAVPLTFAGIVVIGALMIAALAVIFSVIVCIVAVVVTAVIGVVCSIMLLFKSLADGLMNLGMFLFFIGIGIFIVWGVLALGRMVVRCVGNVLGKMIGGKSHEEK